ncbi:MAG: DNA polymerase IV [Bryobacter sp.]|nr:DNA polymerase IV [Bryobacter sp.]
MPLIFHIDMDAFFVSVEELLDPSLKGKPVIVGGPADARGVVSAASYEARKYGIHSAMPLRRAVALCPHATFLDGHMHLYREYSQRVEEVLRSFTPLVEMASIDEAYLDMSGCDRLWGPPLAAAHKLHEAIRAQTGLPNSIGIARSRLVAKIASDQAKRNGILWVLPGTEAHWLAPLEVKRIPGVGKATEQQLSEIGIRFVGDLARLDATFLARRFGKWGLALAGKARGEDAGGWFDGAIGAEEAPKSISHEHTFGEDTADVRALEATLVHLTEKVMKRLREHSLYARTVQLKLRNTAFETITRAETLAEATDVDKNVLDTALRLFRLHWARPSKIRLLGVQVSQLSAEAPQANLLTSAEDEKWRKVLRAADRLKDRFGNDKMNFGAALDGRFRDRVHESAPKDPRRKPVE